MSSTSVDPASDTYETLPQLDDSEFPENARQMMRAAIHLFAEKGFAGTSVREIVSAAGVTNPMLYYYFDDKEGLFETLLTYLFENMRNEMLTALEDAESLDEAVDRTVLTHFEACKRTPVALRFVYSTMFGPERSAPSFDLSSAHRKMVDEIAVVFERAAERGDFEPRERFDATFLTEQLFALLNGHLMRTMKELQGLSSPQTRHAKIAEMLTPEAAADLSAFFFRGAGTFPDG